MTSATSIQTVIVVEGPNGVGKSTVAAYLGDALGGARVTFPESFRRFREETGLDALPPLPRLVYYLGGIAQQSCEIVASGPTVVCDRYFASPLAVMLAEGAIGRSLLGAISSPVLGEIVPPTVTVLLTADHSQLVDRIRRRAETRPGASLRRTLESQTFVSRWTNELHTLSVSRGPVVEVDTSHRTVAEACRAAEEAARGLMAGG